MIKFLDKRKNEINQAFSIRFDGDKAFVKFSRSGKEYKYYKINIEIVDEMPSYGRFPFVLYEYNKQCYNCKSYIGVLTI